LCGGRWKPRLTMMTPLGVAFHLESVTFAAPFACSRHY
jgi:hypothetical protein